MKSTTRDVLREHCLNIIKEIETGEYEHDKDEGPSAGDYLQSALDIRYITDSKKEYLGAKVLVAFGGPNIWINTLDKKIDAYWGVYSISMCYFEDELGLDDYLEDLFNCV